MTTKKGLKFSVIIPVCHGGTFLKTVLSSLRQVAFPPERFEVIMTGADDELSSRIVQEESAGAPFAVSYIDCPEPQRSRQLNEACRMARGRILVFADDDCLIHKDWLEKIGAVFKREKNIGIIGGRDELEHNGSAFDLALDNVLNSFVGTGGMRGGKGPRAGKYYPKLWNMAVPRQVALQVASGTKAGRPQVFNEILGVHEDVDLTNRIEQSGKRIVFAPEVRVGHSRDTSFLAFAARNLAMAGTSRALGVHRLPHLALAMLALGAPALAFAAFYLNSLRPVLQVFLAIYGAVLLASAVRGGWRTGSLRVLSLVPLLLITLHLARGLGYLLPGRGQEMVRS